LRGGRSTARGRDPGGPRARRLPRGPIQLGGCPPSSRKHRCWHRHTPAPRSVAFRPHGATPVMCFLRRHEPDQVVAVAVGTASQLGASDLSEGRQLPRISRASHLLHCTDGMTGTRAVRPCPAGTTRATGRHPSPRRRDGHAGLGREVRLPTLRRADASGHTRRVGTTRVGPAPDGSPPGPATTSERRHRGTPCQRHRAAQRQIPCSRLTSRPARPPPRGREAHRRVSPRP
jgi:hypothetical protein